MLGSTQQVARILFEKLELTPGRKGKTGYSTDTRVLRSIRGEHEIVEVIEEWREYSKLLNTYLGPLPTLIGEDGRAAHDLQPDGRRDRAGSRRRTRTCRRSRSAPSSGARSARPSSPSPGTSCVSADYSQVELRILAHVSGEPKLREAFERGEDIHTATAAEVLGKDPATLTKDERNVAKMVNFGIIYGISVVRALGEPRDPARGGAGLHRRVPGALPARAGLHPADDRAGGARRLRDDAVRPAPAGAGDPRARTGRRARSASGSRSTRSCRARRRT